MTVSGQLQTQPSFKPTFFHYVVPIYLRASQVIKNLPVNVGEARDVGSSPGLGRFPGGGNGHPLQYSCLENPMDRGAWHLQSMGLQRVRHSCVHMRAHTHKHTAFI